MAEDTGTPGPSKPTGEKYSDRVPHERFAARLGVEYPNALVDLLLDALDEVIDIGTPEQRVARQRRINEYEGRAGRRAPSSRSSAGQVHARRVGFCTGLHVALTKIAKDGDQEERTRRVALVASAVLLLVMPMARELHGRETASVAGRDVIFDDLVSFVSWAASGEEMPEKEQRAAQALARARGDATVATTESDSTPDWPNKGSLPWKTLQALLSADVGVYISEHDLPGKRTAASIHSLRRLRWDIETAPRGDAQQGWRLGAAHAAQRDQHGP